MIKKMEVEDIAQILKMDDPIEQVFPCDKGEWIQWLMQYVDNPEVYMIGNVEEKLLSYAVAVNMVTPPLSNTVTIIFMSELNREFIDAIKIWGKEKGAKSIILQSKNKEILETLNVDAVSYVGNWSI